MECLRNPQHGTNERAIIWSRLAAESELIQLSPVRTSLSGFLGLQEQKPDGHWQGRTGLADRQTRASPKKTTPASRLQGRNPAIYKGAKDVPLNFL